MKKPTFPITLKRGSAVVKIYATPTKGYESYTLSYYSDGVRKRPTFAALDEARLEADTVLNRLTKGDLDTVTLTRAECAAFARARELLDPIGVALENAAAQFADATRRLGAVPVSRAVDFYLQRHPTEIKARPVEEVIEELIAAKRQDNLSKRYLAQLGYDLARFATKFSGPIASVRGVEIDGWLRGLGWAPRTRNNMRISLQTLFNYAKARKYLPKEHDELDAVTVPRDRDGEIEIYTPAELTEILTCTSEKMLPFVVIGAFAGIRHAEIQRLEWRDIQFEQGIIEIRGAKAKTASRRLVPIAENLKAWLLPLRQASGPVCSYRNVSNGIQDITAAIGKRRAESGSQEKFVWKHNALRHSFCSYRLAEVKSAAQVALEAGNSPQMIFQHYRELVTESEARTWFSIAPVANRKVVQLPLGKEEGRRMKDEAKTAGVASGRAPAVRGT